MMNTTWLSIFAVTNVIGLLVLVVVVRRAAIKGDLAPGWRVVCPKCGHWRSAGELGIIRIGAYGRKRVPMRCSKCNRIRFVSIERDPTATETVSESA